MRTSSRSNSKIKKVERKHSGLILCIVSLFVLLLLNLPLNLSVLCANQNQGFAFTWGQNLLFWGDLACGRGPLFVFLYAIVLKIFGFNTWAIIGTHILGTVILILCGILIFLIVKKILKSEFYSGLSVLFWVVIITAPLSTTGSLKVEILSHFNLSEEMLCVLFSLCSLYFLLLERSKFLFLSGVFAIFSLMSKINGSILAIATVLWFLQIAIFQKEDFKIFSKKILFYFAGLLSSFFLFNIILYLLKNDLISFWRDYFFIGTYTTEHLKSAHTLLNRFFVFMTRNSSSVSNFILFLFALLLFIWGLIKGCIPKTSQEDRFWSLIGIWGIGNVLVIIIPGEYQPYYYHLIWPQIAIIFVLILNEIFLKVKDKKKVAVTLVIFIAPFFIYRILLSIPGHYNIAKYYLSHSIFNQPQSFQDPVLIHNSEAHSRAGYLQLADRVNFLLPDKKSTLYIFSLSPGGYFGLTPLSYIYSKRYSTTTVDCNLLQISNILESKLRDLKDDLTCRPPELLIIAKENSLQSWQMKPLTLFLQWFSNFTNNNYKMETTLEYKILYGEKRDESYVVYRRIKKS